MTFHAHRKMSFQVHLSIRHINNCARFMRIVSHSKENLGGKQAIVREMQ